MDAGQVAAIALSVVFGAIAVVSLLVTMRARRTKKPAWAIRSNNLISLAEPSSNGLTVLFHDQPVPSLTVSKLLFWNDGSETINAKDVAPNDPLRVKATKEVAILDIKILDTTVSPSGFAYSISPDNSSFRLEFGFLEPGRGAVSQVVHSGASSCDLKIVGHVIGTGSPVHRQIRLRNYLPFPIPASFKNRLSASAKRRSWLIFGASLQTLLMVFGAAFGIVVALQPDIPSSTLVLSYSIGGITFAVGFFGFWYVIYDYLLTSTPRGLEEIEEDIDFQRSMDENLVHADPISGKNSDGVKENSDLLETPDESSRDDQAQSGV
jgi:hypothetical protein